jgi:hypothetical protein
MSRIAAATKVPIGHPGLGIDVDENRLRRRQHEFKRVA